jgi:T5SS/PEP-CTERM-associated repeat protein
MKTPISSPTTRASLVATAAYNTRWFASLLAGTTVLGTSALAVDNIWTGAALDNDWNNGTNWSQGHIPAKVPHDEDAVINVTAGFPVVVASIGGPPKDIRIGHGAAAAGRLDLKSGVLSSGDGHWIFVGGDVAAAVGTLNIADVDGSGGSLTGFGTGTGSVTIPNGRLNVGGRPWAAGGGTGTLNVNTSGTISVVGELTLGMVGGTGTMNVDAGTITIGGGWYNNAIGRNDGGAGNGILNMSGGTLTSNDSTRVAQQDCNGQINLSGGDFLNNGSLWVGENANSNGDVTVSHANSLLQVGAELFIGQGAGGNGSLTVSEGAVTVGNWFEIGREGATGTVDLDGGSITKTGNGDLVLGSAGSGGSGTLTQDGGTLTTNNTMKVGASGGRL